MLSVSKIQCVLLAMCLLYYLSHTNTKQKVVAIYTTLT